MFCAICYKKYYSHKSLSVICVGNDNLYIILQINYEKSLMQPLVEKLNNAEVLLLKLGCNQEVVCEDFQSSR